MALEITSVMTEIEFIHLLLPPLNLRRNLEQNLLDHNPKCKDCECHSAYVKHRREVFLTNPVTKRCRKFGRATNHIPFGGNKQIRKVHNNKLNNHN